MVRHHLYARLLVPQRLDEVHQGGLAGGIEAEEGPHRGREAEGEDDRRGLDDGAPASELAQDLRRSGAEGDPEQPAEDGS